MKTDTKFWHEIKKNTKQIKNFVSALKTKLLTIAPSSQFKALAASFAVLAVSLRTWTCKFLSNLFKTLITL